MTDDSPRRLPGEFLALFRRRSLLISALMLSFYAAFANELVRWSAVFANRYLGADLPVLSVGPLVFVALFAAVLRKWSRPYTAARADAFLDFRDRLTSFVDFAQRRDLPGFLVSAQEEEVSAALKSRGGGRLTPLQPLLCAGPLVLLLSVVYPGFMMPSYAPPLQLPAPSAPQSSRPSGTAEDESDSSAAARDDEEGAVASGEEEEDPEEGTADGTPSPSGTPDTTGSGDGGTGESRGEVPGPTASNNPFEKTGPLVSERIGKALSKVVDPVFAPDGEGAEPAELPRGSMTYRLLPQTVSGEGKASGKSFTEAEANRIVVDFEQIPERYRAIVSTYYTLLAGDQQIRPDTVEGKEQP